MAAMIHQTQDTSAARAFCREKMAAHLKGNSMNTGISKRLPFVILLGTTAEFIYYFVPAGTLRQWVLLVFIPIAFTYGFSWSIEGLSNTNVAKKLIPYIAVTMLVASPFMVFSTGIVQTVSWTLVGTVLGLTLLYSFVGAISKIPSSLREARELREARRRLEVIQQTSIADVVPEEPPKPRCAICKEESQYEVCLACEKTFQSERHKLRAQILRAKQAGVPATLTLPEWLETVKSFHSHCAYCHGPYQLIEHYIPISQGGGTTKENCAPACFKCNGKKGGKHPEK